MHSNLLYKSTQTVFPAPVMLISMTLYWVCSISSTFHSSLRSLPIYIHILLSHLFPKASPINLFIIYSVMKSNICIVGIDR